MKNPRLERLNQEHRTAEIRLTREKHRQKQQQAEAKELTRKARTRRLCTCGGMLESFLQAPNILTDDDVMDLLTFIFRQHSVQENCITQSWIERKRSWQKSKRKRRKTRNESKGATIHRYDRCVAFYRRSIAGSR